MSPAEYAGLPPRRLLALLGVSVAVHGIALFGVRLPSPPPAPALLAALQATLRLPSPSPAVAERDAVSPPPAPKGRHPPARRELRALPAALAAAGPTAAAAAPSPAVASSPLATDAPLPVAAAALPVPAAPAVAEADAARRLADYGERLSELFARQQQYPRLALQRGWEGEVRVRLSVARRGSLAAIRLERSSGHAVLDRHALAMIEAIGELPPPPAEFLQFADDVQVVVPVHYRLRKST